jgi:signal recognition particle GTPase
MSSWLTDAFSSSHHRSGAVEQLRVHVRNLSMLGVNGATDGKGRVELFERGYGKDAAGIAKEAITYGMFCSVFYMHG